MVESSSAEVPFSIMPLLIPFDREPYPISSLPAVNPEPDSDNARPEALVINANMCAAKVSAWLGLDG